MVIIDIILFDIYIYFTKKLKIINIIIFFYTFHSCSYKKCQIQIPLYFITLWYFVKYFIYSNIIIFLWFTTADWDECLVKS